MKKVSSGSSGELWEFGKLSESYDNRFGKKLNLAIFAGFLRTKEQQCRGGARLECFKKDRSLCGLTETGLAVENVVIQV